MEKGSRMSKVIDLFKSDPARKRQMDAIEKLQDSVVDAIVTGAENGLTFKDMAFFLMYFTAANTAVNTIEPDDEKFDKKRADTLASQLMLTFIEEHENTVSMLEGESDHEN